MSPRDFFGLKSLTLGAANVDSLARAERTIGELSIMLDLWSLGEAFAGGVLLPWGALSLAREMGFIVSPLELFSQRPNPRPTRPGRSLRWALGIHLALQKVSAMAQEQPITPSLTAQIFRQMDAPHLKREPSAEEPDRRPLPGSAVWAIAPKWAEGALPPLWAGGLALATWEREGPEHLRRTPAGMIMVCGLGFRLGLTSVALFRLYANMVRAARNLPGGLAEVVRQVRKKGAWREFMGLFFQGAAGSAQAQVRAMMSARKLHREHSDLIKTWTRAPRNPLKLLELLYRRPVVDIPYVAQNLWVTQRTAGLLVKKLVQHGLLKEITGQRRGRKFAYEPLLAIMQD